MVLLAFIPAIALDTAAFPVFNIIFNEVGKLYKGTLLTIEYKGHVATIGIVNIQRQLSRTKRYITYIR